MEFNSELYFSCSEITTQDVLDEISLSISISGCPLHCRGCHSSFTWNSNFGEKLTNEKFELLINKNKYISCILFYGGEWQIKRLLELINIAKQHNLKVCLYTGLMLEEIKQTKIELLNVLDYIKVGRWIEEKGGLNKKTTNQRFYKIINENNKNESENKQCNKSDDLKYKNITISNIKLIDWTKRFFQS